MDDGAFAALGSKREVVMTCDWSTNLNFWVWLCVLTLSVEPALGSCSQYEGKWVDYRGEHYCLKFDSQAADRVHSRNNLMGLINETHLAIVQVGKVIKDKQRCVMQPQANRDAQQDCLRQAFEIRGTLKAAAAAIKVFRQRSRSLSVPPAMSDLYQKDLFAFEQGVAASAIANDRFNEKAESSLSKSLSLWLSLNQNEWRNEGSNKTYCSLLKGNVRLIRTWLVSAYRAESQSDTYGISEAFTKAAEIKARAETGYKLCGFAEDETLREVENSFAEIQSIKQRQSPEANFKKACAKLQIQNWPDLKQACLNSPLTQELEQTLHNALTLQYREEN
jgi:hypothetical protein